MAQSRFFHSAIRNGYSATNSRLTSAGGGKANADFRSFIMAIVYARFLSVRNRCAFNRKKSVKVPAKTKTLICVQVRV